MDIKRYNEGEGGERKKPNDYLVYTLSFNIGKILENTKRKKKKTLNGHLVYTLSFNVSRNIGRLNINLAGNKFRSWIYKGFDEFI